LTTQLSAVLYCRKSNEDGGESVDQQLAWGRETAAKEGITIEAEFVDQAKKGWETAKRTKFHEMLAFSQQRHREGRPIDLVLCWHANRFSRADSQETAWFIWEFRRAGVGRMLTATRWVDFSRMEDRILFNIEQDASNHNFLLGMARDATRGRIAAALEGRWNGGPAPYGYRVEYELVSVKGRKKRRPLRLVVGPDAEVEVVRWLFATYAAGKMTLRGLALDLNRRRIPSPKGAPVWGQGTIKKLLGNEVYLGRIVWNRKHEGRFFGVIDCKVEPSKKKAQRTVQNDPAEWIRRDNRHEALIDEATWLACRRKLAENKKTRPGRNQPFALSGLLVCGNCGRGMVGCHVKVTKKRTGKTYTYRRYVCGGYNTYGSSLCGHNPIDEDKLLKVLVAKLKNIPLEALRGELRRQVEVEGKPEGGRIAGQLAKLDEEISRASRRLLTEPDESLVPALRAEVQKLNQERLALQEEIEKARRQHQPDEDPEELIAMAEKLHHELETAIATADPALVLAVLRERISKIELWFRHEMVGKEKRCTFARGLIWGRRQTSTGSSTVPGHGQSSRNDGPIRE
jgi:site-specific DNA recombinase